jgi:hypothetical protein
MEYASTETSNNMHKLCTEVFSVLIKEPDMYKKKIDTINIFTECIKKDNDILYLFYGELAIEEAEKLNNMVQHIGGLVKSGDLFNHSQNEIVEYAFSVIILSIQKFVEKTGMRIFVKG